MSVRLTKGGKGVRGKTVRLRGPGFDLHKRTGRGGKTSFKVKPSKSGRATASASLCGGKLRVSAARVKTRRAAGSPRFTG